MLRKKGKQGSRLVAVAIQAAVAGTTLLLECERWLDDGHDFKVE